MDKPGFDARRFGLSRRTAAGALLAAALAQATGLIGWGRGRAGAQGATPAPGQCVATAPPADETGVGFVSLLVGGIVHDMPPGPVEVRLSRFTLAPGTPFPAGAVPYPALMYIETGTTACPGGAGRISYAPDGAVIEVTTGEGTQYTPAGATQYIPANVPDGAGNEGTELMSSLIIEFVPAPVGGTPAAGA